VSNLEAIAWFGTAPLRAALLDARRGQIYGAVYDAQSKLVSPEVVASFPEWLKTLPEGDIEFLSPALDPFHPALLGTHFETAPAHNVPRALAGAIAQIAGARHRAGQASDPAALDAIEEIIVGKVHDLLESAR
jgi:tRNA A37 threonylcarbamoyladenosine modification protein TsaB